MKRDLDAFVDRRFDVLVIGGGIYGACIARDAALRGLSVALIEKSDFCSGTSHNSLKIIHSGIRYLQHLDFKRVRESINERRIWLSIAPHLVRPLKFVIPTQGWLTRGPLALQAAILMHRFVGLDWNRDVPEASRVPLGRVRGRSALKAAIPGLPTEELSGMASWHDGQVVDADRLVIECLRSAVEHGAVVANYLAAGSLMRSRGRICGAVAVDGRQGREVEVHARLVVNAAGPWVEQVLRKSAGSEVAASAPPLARNMNIVTRQLLSGYGVGIPSKRSSDAVIGSESRLFFVTPWKDVSAIGTTHFPYSGEPDDYAVTEAEIADFVDEINESWPTARLRSEDVLYVYGGLTPAEPESVRGEVGRSKHPEIINHGARHGLPGLISVIGVKFTTGRLVAERVVSLAQRELGIAGDPGARRMNRLPGGLDQGARTADSPLAPYGSRPPRDLGDDRDLPGLLAAFARHAVQEEMALELEDFLLRRNDLAARGWLTGPLIHGAAEAMGSALGWTPQEAAANERRMCESLRYLQAAPDSRAPLEREGRI